MVNVPVILHVPEQLKLVTGGGAAKVYVPLPRLLLRYPGAMAIA
jgi:hypothetical protein